MLTYSPQQNTLTKSPEKPWLLLLLAFVWLWPGIVSRDLWNPAEPYLYVAIQSILEQDFNNVPTVFGEYVIQQSPLYLWIAAFFQTIFSPWLMSSYTAVRLTTVLFMSIAFLAMGGAGQQLLGRRNGRSVVLIILGCPGIIVFGHMLGFTPVLFAGLAMALYGMALAPHKVLYAGILIALGSLLTFLAANFPPLIFLATICLFLPIHHQWRNRQYLIAIIIALVICLPLLFYGLKSFAINLPTLFYVWLKEYSLSGFGGWGNLKLGFSLLKLLETILWFTFPALPLTIWTLYKQKNQAINANRFICMLWLILGFIGLCLNPDLNNEYIIFITIPLAVMGAAELDSLRRGSAAFLNWFGIMTFGIIALTIWLAFFATTYGFPQILAEQIVYYNPYYQASWNYFPILVALAFTPIWLLAVSRKNIKGRQAVTNWVAGITFTWTLMLSIFLPWLDASKSYRPVVERMELSLSSDFKHNLANKSTCISSNEKTALIAWQEYSNLNVQLTQKNDPCRYHLIKTTMTNLTITEGWQVIWMGSRPRAQREIFALLEKIPNND